MHFFIFFFLQNITQSMVPNIEKFAIQQTVLEQTAVIVKYKFIKCRLKSTSQREIRLAREKYLQEVVCEDSKRFWSYIKHQKQDSNGVSPLKGPDGLLHSDTSSKAEILNNQFHSVYTKEDLSNMPSKGDSPHSTMDNIHVGVNGVCKLLKGLNVHKATGPDAVPTRFLHDFAVELAPIMTKLFQLSLDTGKIPDDWREASIVPVFKKGGASIGF